MSTRSTIIRENAGAFERIYCHSDGYLDHNGRVLAEHYATEERVAALFELGSLSFLDVRCDAPPGHRYGERVAGCTVAYCRDRGESWEDTKPRSYATLEEAMNDHEGYCYVWQNGAWMVECAPYVFDEDAPYVPKQYVRMSLTEALAKVDAPEEPLKGSDHDYTAKALF